MAIKTVNGVPYFTIPDAAKYLGMSTIALRKIALSEGLDFLNIKDNGKLMVTVESIKSFQRRQRSINKNEKTNQPK